MSRIEAFFEKAVAAGIIPQVPMNYDAVAYKICTGYLENKTDELTAENAELRQRLDKAIELPPGDRVWYIAEDEEGQESYIIPKPTSSLTVEELKYEMDKKYLSTREAAEARLKELKEKI